MAAAANLSLLGWVMVGLIVVGLGVYALSVARHSELTKPAYFLILVAVLFIPTIVLGFFLHSRAWIRSARVYVGGPAALFMMLLTFGMQQWTPEETVILGLELAADADDQQSRSPATDWKHPDLLAQISAGGTPARGVVSSVAPRLLQFDRPAGFHVGDDVTLDVRSERGRHIFEAIRVYGEGERKLGGVSSFREAIRLERTGTIVIHARRRLELSVRALVEDAEGRVLRCDERPLTVDYVGEGTSQKLAHAGDCLFVGLVPEPRAGTVLRVRRGDCAARLEQLTGTMVRLTCGE
jgi:hypothetical protein